MQRRWGAASFVRLGRLDRYELAYLGTYLPIDNNQQHERVSKRKTICTYRPTYLAIWNLDHLQPYLKAATRASPHPCKRTQVISPDGLIGTLQRPRLDCVANWNILCLGKSLLYPPTHYELYWLFLPMAAVGELGFMWYGITGRLGIGWCCVLGSECCVCLHGAGWLGVSVGAFFWCRDEIEVCDSLAVMVGVAGCDG